MAHADEFSARVLTFGLAIAPDREGFRRRRTVTKTLAKEAADPFTCRFSSRLVTADLSEDAHACRIRPAPPPGIEPIRFRLWLQQHSEAFPL